MQSTHRLRGTEKVRMCNYDVNVFNSARLVGEPSFGRAMYLTVCVFALKRARQAFSSAMLTTRSAFAHLGVGEGGGGGGGVDGGGGGGIGGGDFSCCCRDAGLC